MAVTSDKRFRKKQGLENGLFRSLGSGLKQRVHPAVRRVQERHGLFRGEGQVLGGGKGDGDITAAVPVDGACPRKAVPGPTGQTSELRHIERSIRG